jgi:hypothetical protein
VFLLGGFSRSGPPSSCPLPARFLTSPRASTFSEGPGELADSRLPQSPRPSGILRYPSRSAVRGFLRPLGIPEPPSGSRVSGCYLRLLPRRLHPDFSVWPFDPTEVVFVRPAFRQSRIQTCGSVKLTSGLDKSPVKSCSIYSKTR